MTYFDYAAATPMDKSVLAAMLPYFEEKFYNPAAIYAPALGVKQDLAQVRQSVAAAFGCRPGEVIFTAGGTEANNLAIHGVMALWPEGNMVISAIEHDSVREPAANHNVRIAPVDGRGIVDVERLISLIDDKTVLVSVMLANNEVGTVQPIQKIAKELQKIRVNRKKLRVTTPLYFHTDACQAVNYVDCNVARLGVDFIAVNGGKIYGPKQSGMLYVRGGIRLEPIIRGGGQEFGVRSGTQNVPAIVGFGQALSIAAAMRKDEVVRMQKLQQLADKLIASRIPQARRNGSSQHRLPNNIHLTLPGVDNERLIFQLDQQGIQVAAGSACSASKQDASHVLLAMGIPEVEARASIRCTMGRQTTEADIQLLVATLDKLLN